MIAPLLSIPASPGKFILDAGPSTSAGTACCWPSACSLAGWIAQREFAPPRHRPRARLPDRRLGRPRRPDRRAALPRRHRLGALLRPPRRLPRSGRAASASPARSLGGAVGAAIGGRRAASRSDAARLHRPRRRRSPRPSAASATTSTRSSSAARPACPGASRSTPANRPAGYEPTATFHPTFLYESLWDLLRRRAAAGGPGDVAAARRRRDLRAVPGAVLASAASGSRGCASTRPTSSARCG